MKKFILCTFVSTSLVLSNALAASSVAPPNPTNTQTVYGPKAFTAALGQGKTYNDTFKARSNVDGVITVINGSGNDLYTVTCSGSILKKLACELENVAKKLEVSLLRAKTVRISLNGQVVLPVNTLNPAAGRIQISIKTLNGTPVAAVQNILKVELVGAIASSIKVEVKAQTGQVNQLPIARLAANPPLGVAPLIVNFSGLLSSDSDGGIASYDWNFGDPNSGVNNVASGSVALHTYTTVGNYTVTLVVKDNQGASGTTTFLVKVAANTLPLANFTMTPSSGQAPLPVAFDAAASSDVDGSITSYQWNFGDGTTGSGVQAAHTYANAGTYNVILTVGDDKGGSATKQLALQVAPPNVAPIAKIRQSATQGISPLMVEFDGTTSADSDGTIASYQWDFGDGKTGTGARITHEFPTGSFTITLNVKDNSGAEAQITSTLVTSDPVLPAKPEQIAPVLSSTSLALPIQLNEFLYTGENPIQTGVAEGTIDKRFVSVIRGRVLQEDGSPLSGVKVSILGDSSFGQTISREDGVYDLAVNGGAPMTVSLERNGFYEVQRQVNPPHQGFGTVNDVYMLRPDPVVTVVKTNSDVPQIAKGSTSSDSDGVRTATVFIPSNTGASLRMPDGSQRSVPQLSIRAKEYTVGENGPNRMPAELPASTAYTYAVQVTADEVAAYGAAGVEFTKPVSFYVDNFLGFPTGSEVPVGIYDTDKGHWVPSKNSRVIRILSIDSGKAILDVTGNGVASASDLTALGIDNEELQTLGSTYAAGVSLWRARLNHFSIVDINAFQKWLQRFKIPDDVLRKLLEALNQSCPVPGSIIQPETRTLGESLGILGTPYTLNYSTNRVPGKSASRTIDIDITPADLSGLPGLKGVDLKIVVAGQEYKESFSAEPGQRKRFTWNGTDAYGRLMYGGQQAEVTLSYKIEANYLLADRLAADESTFAYLGPGLTVTSIPSREELVFAKIYKTFLGTSLASVAQGVGNWTFDVHHTYDPVTKTLYTGDGSERSAGDIGNIIKTVVGTGTAGFFGDGGPATSARIAYPGDITIGNDNTIYFRDALNFRIRKVNPAGIISTIAGIGSPGVGTDGELATQSRIGNYGGIAIADETYDTPMPVGGKTIYFSENSQARIKKITPDGRLSTIAGTGVNGFSGDGGPAKLAQIHNPTEIIAKDGSVYFCDSLNHRVRVIRPDGIIKTVVGNGIDGFSGDDGPAVDASISLPVGLTIGPNGDLFLTDTNNGRIRQVDRSGIIRTVAGGGTSEADGIPAENAKLVSPTRVIFSSDSTMYIASPLSTTLRRVSVDGIISTFAGTTVAGAGNAEGELAGQVNLIEPFFVAMGPDDALYLVEQQKIKKISRAFAGVGDVDVLIPSPDGSELYVFDAAGRHLETKHGLTGGTKYKFNYSSSNRLTSIVDGDGNVTSIVRNASGEPSQIQAPFGQVTNVAIGSNGYLSAITNPNGESHNMTYFNGGLLASFAKPRGNTSRFTYDSLGQLVKDQDAVGGFTLLAQTAISGGYSVPVTTAGGRVSSIRTQRDANGGSTSTRVDPDGLVTQSIMNMQGGSTFAGPTRSLSSVSKADPRLGGAAQYNAKQIERLTSGHTRTSSLTRTVSYSPIDLFNFVQSDIVVQNGRTSSRVFNSTTRTWTTTSSEGRVQKVVVDDQHRPLRIQIAGMVDQVFSYSTTGKLEQVVQGQRVTNYSYDSKGRLESATNSLGEVTRYAYDNSDRMTNQTLRDGRVLVNSYDANGNIIGVTPSGKPQHIMSFNLVDMVTSYLPPILGGPQPTQYTYNLDKQVSSIQTADGAFANYIYADGSTRLNRIVTNTGSYQFTYGPSTGLLSQMSSPSMVTTGFSHSGGLVTGVVNSGQAFGTVTFSYDNDFRLSTSVINEGQIISYAYNNDGQLTAVGPLALSYSTQNTMLSSSQVGGVETGYSYSSLGELSALRTRHSGVFDFSTSLVRDGIGRIKMKTDEVNGVNSVSEYTYDPSGRLTDVVRNGVPDRYTYDSNGNRLSVVRGGQITTAQYNDQDQLLSYGDAQYTYKADGSLLTKIQNGEVTTYDYDIFGNLRSVALSDGRTLGYIMDAKNRRVGKLVNGMRSKFWVYESQLKIAAELDGSGQLVSRFIYGAGPSPEAMIKGGVNYKIVKDHLGSVRFVINASTGDVAQSIEYDEFGRVLSDSNPGFQPFGFAGGLYDIDTKLVRFGARDYEAEVGRWTAKDPILFAGSINFYGYCNNDPVNNVDRTGLYIEDNTDGAIPDPLKETEAYRNIHNSGRTVKIRLGTVVGAHGQTVTNPDGSITITLDPNQHMTSTGFIDTIYHEMTHAQRAINNLSLLEFLEHGFTPGEIEQIKKGKMCPISTWQPL